MPTRTNFRERRESRYKEAVERNIRGASANIGRFMGIPIDQAKHRLGIRESDQKYNDRLLAMTTDATPTLKAPAKPRVKKDEKAPKAGKATVKKGTGRGK